MARYSFPAPKPTPAEVQSGKRSVASDPYQSVLETQFPRILDKITMMWGFQELNAYFASLLLDDSGAGRQGFPPEAWEEIHVLSSLHLLLVPSNNPF
jgi:hypothetical protein